MRILAVDDDTAVLQALLAALRQLPEHQLRAATNGNQAYQTAMQDGGTDLLVTDVVMDPMDGLSLRNALLGEFPNLRTIFISGYDLSEYAEQIGETPLLAKPLDVAALLEAVQSELAKVTPAQEPETAPIPAPVAVPVARAVAPQAAPVAVPVARPVAAQAAPVAVPVARAAVTPPAAPASVPVARPVVAQAAPVAVPKAVAAPTSVAAPKAVAVPRAPTPVSAVSVPKAVPAAVAAPKAAAVPVAAPKAVPGAPKAVAAPSVAVPRATAVPVAAPRAVPVSPSAAGPVAKATAAPVARAVPAAPVARAVPVASAPPAGDAPTVIAAHGASEAEAHGLLGQVIGGYKVVSLLGKGRWGPVFAAVQVAINRRVGLKLLDPALAQDEEQRQRFIADARAKANVQHPSILSVYEAGAADAWIFYTQEFVDGENLSEMASTGRKIDQPTALKLIRTVVEGLLYFESHTVPHTPLQADAVFLAADGQPRLSNLATQHSDSQTSTQVEIETLGRAVLGVLPMTPDITASLRMLLGRTMRTNPSPLTTWAGLLQGVKALEPKVVPVEAAKISAQDRAAVEAVEKARQQQKRAFWINVGAMISLLVLAGTTGYFMLFRSNERSLNSQIHIPAGDFISGNGVNSKNEEFWIDKYETTIGQYAKFVQYIEANPSEEHVFDHPRQPRMISHIPPNWAIYYGQAAAGKAVASIPTSLNAPANVVNWWDAFAYAKWKGRELPTELEWERAARGTRGQAFPWGEEPDAKKANTNSDHDPRNPGKKGNIDGFNFWGDVDQQNDRSPDGVIGMAGNVSEWTASWSEGNKFPIIKGGNYSLPLMPLGEKIENHPAAPGEEYIGFRTISHKPPEK